MTYCDPSTKWVCNARYSHTVSHLPGCKEATCRKDRPLWEPALEVITLVPQCLPPPLHGCQGQLGCAAAAWTPLGQSEKLQGRELEQRGVAAPEAGRLLRAMMSQDPF